VFLVNSRYPLVTATCRCSGRKALHIRRLTFFRSYGDNLPSSLTTVLSSALGCSPCLPESVCGTDDDTLRLRLFLEAWAYPVPFTPKRFSLITSQANGPKSFSSGPPYRFEPRRPTLGRATLLRPLDFDTCRRCRNVDLLTITYALRPRLRLRLTLGGLSFPRKPKAYGDVSFSLRLSLLMAP